MAHNQTSVSLAKDSPNTSMPSQRRIEFIDKITLPGDKQYQRISLICGFFWLPLPEWHSILVISLEGTIERKVQHKFIKQPKAVESVLEEHVLIGCSTGLFCMSAKDSEDCRIIADGNITDVSVSKNYICAYEFKRKVILVYRRTGSEWVQCEVVRPMKDVFQRLLLKDDIIFVQFENFKVCSYTKRGELIQAFQIDLKGSKSPKNALRLCQMDEKTGSLFLANWFKHTIDVCEIESQNKSSTGKPGKSSGQDASVTTVNKLSLKLDEIKNPNDLVLSGSDLFILAGASIAHCKYVSV